MTVTISPAAAHRIAGLMKSHIAQVGEQFVPVITWVIGDTNDEASTPYLGLGLIEEKKVPADRWVLCDDFKCKIAQHIPDDILVRAPSQFIDLVGEALRFVEP